MPPVVAFLTAVGSFVTFSAVAGTAAAVIGAATIVGGVFAASKMLKPKINFSVDDNDRSRQTTVRSTTEPRKLVYGETMVSGPLTYAQVSGSNNKHLHQVVALAGHELTQISKLFLDDKSIDLTDGNIYNSTTKAVTSGFFGPKNDEGGNSETVVYIDTRLGTASQTAYAGLRADSVTSQEYLSTHRGDNVASVYTRWTINEGSREVWDEVGNVQNIKALVKGKKIYDPRLEVNAGGTAGASPTNASYVVYDNDTLSTASIDRGEQGRNPALMIADYLMDDEFGLGIPSSKIDWAAIIAAADDCDTLVDIPNSATQKRFFGSGVIFGADPYAKSIEKILSGMNGSLVYSQGKYIVRAGVYVAPTESITEDDIIGEVDIRTAIPRSDRLNQIKGLFIDPTEQYKMMEFGPVTVSGAIARDNGEVLEEEIKLPFTDNRYAAQRIAFKQVNQSFLQTMITVPVNLKGMRIAVGDRVNVYLTDLESVDSGQWNPKIFKCINWSFAENGSGGINLTLLEDAQTRYADPIASNYSTITAEGTITTSLPDVPAPTNFSATAAINSIELAWDNPPNTAAWEQIWVYSNTSNTEPTDNSTPIAKFRGTSFTDTVPGGTTKYYWIQAVRYPQGSTPSSGNANKAKSVLVASSPTNVAASKIGNAVMDSNSIDSAQIISGAVSSTKIATTIQSDNWSVQASTGWQINRDGSATFQNAVVRGTVTATDGTIGGLSIDTDKFYLGTGTYSNSNTKFYVDDQGQFSLGDKLSWDGSTLTISGSISATTGTVGGFTVGATSLIAGADATRISLSTADGIHLGNNTFASAPFRVTPAGVLTATSATLTGALTATSLNITNTATVTDPQNLVNNAALEQEILKVEVEAGDVLDLETGAEVDIQNLGDVAIYVSDQDAILQGNINTVALGLSNLEATIVDLTSGVSDIYIQTTAPVPGQGGIPDPIPDFSRWYDSDDDNHPYYWTGSAWVSLEDPRIGANANSITNLTANLSTTNTNVAANTALAQGKIQSYFQDAEPSGGTYATGDLWFDTNDKNKVYRYSGSAWVAARDSDIAQAISDASDAQATADGKVQTFIQNDAPVASDSGLNALFTGDLWIDSNDSNKLYRWSGSSWVAVRDSGIEANANAISVLDSTVSGIDGTVTALSTSNTNLVATIDFITKVSDESGSVLEDETSTTQNPVEIGMQDLTDVASATGEADQTLQTRVTSTEDTITIQSTELTLLNSILTDGSGNLTGSANAVSALQTDVTQINTLDGTSTSASATALTALKSTVEDPNTGLSAVGGIVSSLTANVGDGATLVSDAQTLYAITGALTTNNWSATQAYVAGDGVVSGGLPYVCVLANTGNVPPNSTYWNPVDTTAALITDNNVARIGYCVDSNGDLTDHKNATLCVAAGNTWNGDAAIAEAVKALRIVKPDGTYATIEDATSVISDDVGDVTAQKFIKIDNNGAISGYGLSSTTSTGTTESVFKVTANKFTVLDPDNASADGIAPFTVTSSKIVMGTDVQIDGGLVVSGTIKADRLSLNGTMFTTETVGSDVNLVIADGGVDTTQVADNAVTIDKIADTIQSTDYSAGSAGWKLTTDGTFEAGDGTFRGNITSTSGTIGGFTLGATSLTAGDGATRVSLSTADGISLGNNTFANAPFRVTPAGALTATSATISGAITATSGSFTGAVSVGTAGAFYGGTMDEFNDGLGFFLGYDTDAYKLSIGDSSTGKSLTWDGDKLNVAANAVSFATGGEPTYDSNSKVPVAVRSSVLDLTSNTDYVFFANDFDQNLTLYASFYAGPLTSGTISGETNAQNAIMSQLSLQIQYAPNSGGSPGTWVNFGSAGLSSKKFTSGQLNSNYYVKVTDLGSGNYRADLATASQAAADFTGLGHSDYAYGITDEDYYMTEQVTVYGFPKGEYFIRVVVAVTDGTYSPYPATGSPALTNPRRLSINNALTYTDSDHGLSSVAKGNPQTYFTGLFNNTLVDGGSLTIAVNEENATSNRYGGIFIAGRGETTDPNSIQPLGGIFFYNGVDDLGSGAGSIGSPDHTISVPKTGDSLDIEAAGNGIKFNGGYAFGGSGATIDTNGNYFANGNITISGTVSQGSDIRLKSDVETIDGSKVFDMRGVSFVKNGEKGAGVIAQELQEIAPELVKEGLDGMLSVAYGDLIGYLIESVKTLKDEIDQIKADQS